MKINLQTKKKSGIYCIMNKINNKKYIGSSISLYYRLNRHKSDLINNKHKNPHLQNSWNKYGKENFECFIIEYCKEDILNKREEYFINIFGDYNCSKFDNGRLIISEESKKKMSITKKRMFKNKELIPNRRISIEQFSLDGDFIRRFDSIKNASILTNISESQLGRCLNNTYKTAGGFQWKYTNSDIKIEKYIKNKKDNSFLNKKVYMIDLLNNIKYIFNNIKECAKYFNVTPQVIMYVIHKSKNNIYKKNYKIGLIKLCELLGYPEEDNQQPSLDGDIFEGSTTRSESKLDNNSPKSSGLHKKICR
jgi:group I intron endonuclease